MYACNFWRTFVPIPESLHASVSVKNTGDDVTDREPRFRSPVRSRDRSRDVTAASSAVNWRFSTEAFAGHLGHSARAISRSGGPSSASAAIDRIYEYCFALFQGSDAFADNAFKAQARGSFLKVDSTRSKVIDDPSLCFSANHCSIICRTSPAFRAFVSQTQSWAFPLDPLHSSGWLGS